MTRIAGPPAHPDAAVLSLGAPVLDVVFIVATVVIFALVGLVAKGVQHL